MKNKMSIDQLRIQTGMKKSDFMKKAGISTSTYRRIRYGGNVSEEMLYRCLRTINEALRTNYRLEDINLEPEEKEEKEEEDK